MEVSQILLKHQLINQAQLNQLRQANGDAFDVAIEMGFVKEEDALQAIGEEVGIDYVETTRGETNQRLRC